MNLAAIGAEQVHKVVQKLQQIAKDAMHERPLMIGIDQENGSVLTYCGDLFSERRLAGLVSAFSLPTPEEAGTQLYA